MRMSRLLFKSLRSVSSEHETRSHRLLLRGSYVHQLGQGLFSMLPLGQKVALRLEAVLRDEMHSIGCQEVSMPVVQPAELWKQSGRYDHVGAELVRLVDRRDRVLVLAMTHEEAATELCRSVVASYRQLPRSVFQIQTKVRDDPRPRAGLIRVRKFRMKDAYSFAMTEESIDEQYEEFLGAYDRIFQRCELPVLSVDADVGVMGGRAAHEFMYLTPVGEDTVILCDSCGFAANRQVAAAALEATVPGPVATIERVATPKASTISELTRALDVAPHDTAKAVFFADQRADGVGLALAVVRGDRDVNETKLCNVVGASELRPVTDDEIRSTGAVPGCASAIGVTGCEVVVDSSIAERPSLVVGANELGFHFRNAHVPRDFPPHVVSNITAVRDGDRCPRCRDPVRASRVVEVANTFKLGTRYSAPLAATARTETGEDLPVAMASYGIGVGRLLACIAEEHSDERSVSWPAVIAPYGVELVAAGDETRHATDALYDELSDAGVNVLYDDRDESAGVKFADADLIGSPVRVVIGRRSLERGGAEITTPDAATRIVNINDVPNAVRSLLG